MAANWVGVRKALASALGSAKNSERVAAPPQFAPKREEIDETGEEIDWVSIDVMYCSTAIYKCAD